MADYPFLAAYALTPQALAHEREICCVSERLACAKTAAERHALVSKLIALIEERDTTTVLAMELAKGLRP